MLLLVAMASLAACSPEDPSDESGVVGTGIIFRGAVSKEEQLAANEVEIRAQTGERTTAIIDRDGQYSVKAVLGVGPWLIRNSLGNGNYHYGIAYPATIAHIHSYTDVVLRSWFLARHDISDIDTSFESDDTLPELPSADQFKTLAGQYLRLVEFVLEDYGLTGDQLLSEPFLADDTGIDQFLDLNPILVDENGGRQITIVITDLASNTQTSTSADILLGAVEGQSDIQPPSIPLDLRALSGDSGETVLVWEPSTDNTAVIGYDVLRNGELIAISPYPVYTDTEASAAASLLYEVKSIDTAGNRSTAAQVSTENIVDVGALSAPVNVVSEVSTTQRVELRWTQDRIDVVAKFNIYRGATADTLSPLVSVTSTSVTDTTVSAAQEYWYAVSAVNARGNESMQSVPLHVLTTGNAVNTPESPPAVVETPDGGGVPVALFGPAQYLVSECGSLPVSSTAVNNSLNTPAQFSVGELVQGQIVPDSADSNFHVWQVSLEPGNYHLVSDTWLVDDGKGAIGLKIESLGARSSDDEQLVADSEFTYDLRQYEYLEIQAATTLTLKIEALHANIHNYTLGIIPNGSAVPSPTFTRCLPINALSTGTTQSLTLVDSVTRADQVWYRIDLEKEEYVLDASLRSAARDAIGYQIELLRPFGDTDKDIVGVSEFDFILSSSNVFEPDVAGPALIRIESLHDSEPQMELTVTTQ